MPPRKRAEPKGTPPRGPIDPVASEGEAKESAAKKPATGKPSTKKGGTKKAASEKATGKKASAKPGTKPASAVVAVDPTVDSAPVIDVVAGDAPVPEEIVAPPHPMREHAPLSAAAIHAIITGTHGDPFGVLGLHEVAGTEVLRAFVPGAERVEAISLEGETLATLERRHDAGFFEGPVQGRPRYLLRATRGDDRWTIDDPYAYSPVLGPMDDWLLGEGTHAHLYDRLGAHLMTHEGSAGVHFALWAPNARRVSVVGNFNRWDGRRHVMRKRHGTGVWEIFVPGLGEGTMYKYELTSAGGRLMPLKSDPVGFGAELRPSTASVVRDTEHFVWNDQEWMRSRADAEVRRAPMAAYEVHLGSWQRGDQGQWLTYDELADRLVPYVKAMGFTHVELMPVNEHPLDKSWGYQPVGMFAPTARFGEPAAFARFVDRCHVEGIGVIIDWVPAHFPTDAHGLARFDGTALYEHEDPRLGFHPDWNTAIYNFGRREVCNFLIASALFWLDRYHIDGLRVDAVASMLYLDYSRKDGEWIPNRFGGRENLEAVAFLRRMNEAVYGRFPGAFTIAEESTAWPAVSGPTFDGGLGFGLKWNMGWMHDTLAYMAEDPVHRRWHHNKMTFGMMYAFTENFVLPLSHDEVVHGKGSLLARFPGDAWRKFAGLRAYLAFTWAYPGKKLLFMGGEFGQGREWDFDGSLDWQLLDVAWHRGVQGLMKDCNRIMRAEGALHERDCEGEGFQWIVVDDAAASVFAWVRRGAEGTRPVVVVSNLTPIPRPSYKLGLPLGGRWTEVLNTDAGFYGGSNVGNAGGIVATEEPSHGYPCSASLTIPPLATLWLVHEA